MFVGGDDVLFGAQDLHFPSSSQGGDVNYSCGSCGYELNLSSCGRNTSVIGSKYGKSMRSGIISFFSIDESRFTQVDELRLVPYFSSKRSWGLFRRRTKLLCGKCRSHIGNAYKQEASFGSFRSRELDLATWDGISERKSYDIKIQALQPSPSENFGNLNVMDLANYG